MDSQLDYHSAKALLEWQIELGADEAIANAPVNRFDVPDTLPKPPKPAPVVISDRVDLAPALDGVAVAKELARGATDLVALKAAIAGFEACELKRGARNLVFGDGNSSARVMVIGEAPGRDEDIKGKPFLGPAGQLLDAMFAAIGLARDGDDDASFYVTNVSPWRPPQNREPLPEEVAMLMPFVQRHIELVQPDVLVLMGNVSCNAVLGRQSIMRARGNWAKAFDVPVMPMLHPEFLLKNPVNKREAWQDLLAIQAKLRGDDVG